MVPGEVSPVADIGDVARRVPRRAGRPALRWATRRSIRPSTRSPRSRPSHGRPTASTRSSCSATARTTRNAPTIGADQMLANLQDLHHSTPVLVFTLAYGADADVATLQSISGATGAHYYDATDPTKVKAVLGDLVTSF